jgi:LacI family transcriptional regulator
MVASKRAKRVTIADVAREAGASVATVSRVLNGVDTVAPVLAERVRTAIGDLGYRPSAAAQGLARGRSGTIGVLVPISPTPTSTTSSSRSPSWPARPAAASW